MRKEESLISLNSDTILDSIDDGIVAIGLNHNILYINRTARELLGVDNGECLLPSKMCKDIISHTGCSFCCLIDTSIKTGKPLYNYEVTFEKEGRKFFFSVNTALLKDINDKVIGGIEIFRDISLLQELKDELKSKHSFNNIIGKNYRIYEVFELLRQLAPTKSTALIEGETGTGKELIANAIHHNSPRSRGPFIKVNCAALSDGLLESELFGHVKGAFTGALTDKAGRFELAHGGTLFLDEVGDISQHTQVKLLRVLQKGEFERVGGTKTIKVDVRIITAYNKDLKEAVVRGEFREDLYYRLRVVPIHLPPLRERKDDIPLLVKHFIKQFNSEMDMNVTSISPAAMKLLMEHRYPGNVRELEHIIEHAFVRCSGKTLHPEHFPTDFQNSDLIGKVINSPNPFKELEREMIFRALMETGWKYQECARKLKMSRTTLWRRMQELNIQKKYA